MRAERMKRAMVMIAACVVTLCCMAAFSTGNAFADVNFSKAKALSLDKKTTMDVANPGNGYEQTYSFRTKGQRTYYVFHVINSTIKADVYFRLYDQDGKQLNGNSNYTKTNDDNKYCYYLNENQKYYVYIKFNQRKSDTAAIGSYVLTIESRADDVGDDAYTAMPVTLNKKYTKTLQVGFDEDWFKFTAEKTGNYEVKVINQGEKNVHIGIFDQDLVRQNSKYKTVGKGDCSVSDSFYLTKGGVYYASCYRTTKDDITGKYTIQIVPQNESSGKTKVSEVKKPAKVTLTSVKGKKKALKVKFKAAKHAKQYQIQVKQNGTSAWKTCTTKSLKKKIKKLQSGKLYNVRVRGLKTANGKTYYGAWSAVKTVKVK